MTTDTVEGTSLMIDRASHTIRLERTLDAPPADVFDAWTQPDQVRCWWDPAGQPLDACEIDLRPGGAFTFVTGRHAEKPFAGRYLEIVPGERLVFEAMGAAGRVTFGAANGRTRLRVEIQCASDEHLDRFLRAGIDEGTARTLQKLDAYLAGARAST